MSNKEMSNNEKILIKIKQALPLNGERPKLISEKISIFLKGISELDKYINEKDFQLKNDIFYDLGRYINYQKFLPGKVIQKLCEGDNYFFMIVTGEIAKVGIKYKKITTTFKEYILYLTKLQMLEENFLLNDCIEKNQELFPFKSERNILKLFQRIQGFDFKNEIKKIKFQIKNSKWMLNPNNIDDFFSLINPSFRNGRESFLSKDMKFPVLLPFYIKDEIIGKNSFIGNLFKCKGIKEFSSYICIKTADVLYIDKSIVPPGSRLIYIFDNRINYSVLDNILKKNIIFKNSNIDYLIKNYCNYFRLIPIQKGQMLISQGRPYEGIFFVNKGIFQLKSYRSYYELQELIFSLRDSLDNFTNYISYIKKREEDDLNSGGNNIKNKLYIYKHPLFLIKSNEKKEITFSTFHAPQIIGLNELYGNKTGIYHFSLYCISEPTEVYFLPNELVNSLLSNNYIYNSIASLIEERVKYLLFLIKKYKNAFEEEFERYMSMSSPINYDKYNNKNLKTLFPKQKRNLFINSTQLNDISNNELFRKKKIEFSSNSENNFTEKININRKLFNSLNSNLNRKKLILKEQDKFTNNLYTVKLNNNQFSLINQHKINILSDNNRSSEKSAINDFYINKNDAIKQNKNIVKSPSMIDIKKDIFTIETKKYSIINNTYYKNKNFNLFNKENPENLLEKKQNNIRLLPLKQISQNKINNIYKDNLNKKPNLNISLIKEKNFLKKINTLYFKKNRESIISENINDNEKVNSIFDRFKTKKKIYFRIDNNNSFNLNESKSNIRRNNINFKKIKSLNLVKSNSYNYFIIGKDDKI